MNHPARSALPGRKCLVALAALAALAGLAFALPASSQSSGAATTTAPGTSGDSVQTAIFAGGCFWCVEKDFDHVEGVLDTVSGYIGGRHDNPTYLSHGSDGHLEAVRITFDPSVTNYDALAHSFLRSIDPLDDGGQFCDRGNSYRTAFFVLDEAQRAGAQAAIDAASQALGRTVVTRILDATAFWPAEDYHQDYYEVNPLRYAFYRNACGRDRIVERLWGADAYEGIAR